MSHQPAHHTAPHGAAPPAGAGQPPQGPPPPAVVMQLLTAKFHPRIMGELCRANVFDLMSKTTPKSAADLAAATGLNQDALYRCLRALTGTPLITESPEHQFSLTPVGEVLQEKHPHSMKGMAIYHGSAWQNDLWSALGHTLKTGEPSAHKFCGKPLFHWFQEHPTEFAEFQAAMDSISKSAGAAVAEAFDFAQYKVICDVGGGHGELLSAILDKAPQSEGILFDLPQVIAQPAVILQSHSAASRVKKVGGDMFESVPSGVDLFILKHIVHDWGDEQCIAVFKNLAKSLNPNGRIITVEHVVKGPGEPDPAKMVDIQMLIATDGGRERTEAEFRDLYHRGGLKVTEIVRTKSPLALIVGVPL